MNRIRIPAELSRQSNRYAYSRLALAYVIVLINSGLIFSPLPLVIKLLLVGFNGFVIAGFFSVLHYCCHGTYFEGKRTNLLYGRFLSTVMLLNFSAYKQFHLQHHRCTGISGDSEPDGAIRNVAEYFWFALNWDYVFAFFRLSVASLIGYFPYFVNKKKSQREVQIDSLFSIAFVVTLLFFTAIFPLQLLLLYWLPLQIAFSLNFIYVIGEHMVEGGEANALSNTQTFKQPSRFFAFFNHNSNFHAAHHYFPQVPPENIPAAHKYIEPHLEHNPVGYLELNFELLKSLWSAPIKGSQVPGEGRYANFFYSLRASRK